MFVSGEAVAQIRVGHGEPGAARQRRRCRMGALHAHLFARARTLEDARLCCEQNFELCERSKHHAIARDTTHTATLLPQHKHHSQQNCTATGARSSNSTSTSSLLTHAPAEMSFFNVSYVCPEPVLANNRYLAQNGAQQTFPHPDPCSRGRG